MHSPGRCGAIKNWKHCVWLATSELCSSLAMDMLVWGYKMSKQLILALLASDLVLSLGLFYLSSSRLSSMQLCWI